MNGDSCRRWDQRSRALGTPSRPCSGSRFAVAGRRGATGFFRGRGPPRGPHRPLAPLVRLRWSLGGRASRSTPFRLGRAGSLCSPAVSRRRQGLLRYEGCCPLRLPRGSSQRCWGRQTLRTRRASFHARRTEVRLPEEGGDRLRTATLAIGARALAWQTSLAHPPQGRARGRRGDGRALGPPGPLTALSEGRGWSSSRGVGRRRRCRGQIRKFDRERSRNSLPSWKRPLYGPPSTEETGGGPRRTVGATPLEELLDRDVLGRTGEGPGAPVLVVRCPAAQEERAER